ncbi:hypothetical protein JQS43_10980 [Natronosporangium hydrolyticum]|uniref:Type III-B CRISPR-associated protein Cas10/Cmr2 n=1 Tax=Natronosporangium hydrolyticum TaxID=2811111 RepID=A0A895YMQ4_9ACTN|nr:type III-B CRISPR-associated protein Cas10/Cmr2 [Natronosporangium hydrolyticum]QSB16749.1 hypothetical protein JQS43_10980 [Natronosporangium hydrolyticum]
MIIPPARFPTVTKDHYERTSVSVLGAAAPAEADDRDLVIVALSGVQSFIAESRTTADLYAASEIVGRLASTAAAVCAAPAGAEVVFPVGNAVASETYGTVDLVKAVPNRVVALVQAGAGAQVAAEAAEQVREEWAGWVRESFGRDISTPGMPSVQWVAVPAGHGDYAAKWRLAQEVLTARKRVRDFPGDGQSEWFGRRLCAQSPRWPAEETRPVGTPPHETDVLSAANWVKRRWARKSPGEYVGFPSTGSIASAPYRKMILGRLGEADVYRAVTDLRRVLAQIAPVRESAVPGLDDFCNGDDEPLARWLVESAGHWVHPDVWDGRRLRRGFARDQHDERDFGRIAAAGRGAASTLAQALGGIPPPAYLAVVAQDLDGMGQFLTENATGPAKHRRISEQLSNLAADQRNKMSAPGLFGVPVYTGGDDLLAFAPAATALQVARACHDLVPHDDLPTPSTAILYFHRGASLQRAVSEVGRLLHDAKASHPAKHALAVGFLRRSGARESTIQPWVPAPELAPVYSTGDTAADLLRVFADETGRRISPRLLSDLTRDAEEFADQHLPEELYEAELARLVVRHGGTLADGKNLASLGYLERAGRPTSGDGRRTPERAARVAVFLRQECGQMSDQSAGAKR